MPGHEPRILGAKSLRLSGSFSDSDTASPSSWLRPKFSKNSEDVHPFEDQEKLRSCVRLFNAAAFQALPKPLPRGQDLPEEYFGKPDFGDQVISVSHAWRNQAHPDPTCYKMKLLTELLSTLNFRNGLLSPKAAGKEPRVFLFFDFLSIPQKPFQLDQKPRTPFQTRQFQAALECMHEAFYYSDRIIHLPWENVPVPGEGSEHTIPALQLQSSVFGQVGDAVQIVGRRGTLEESSISTSSSRQQAHLFDQVVSVDDQEASTVGQVEGLLRNEAWTVRLRSFPFGVSSGIPADVRGWIFLERFISMVKCAMMDEEAAKQIIITPSEGIFEEIMNGASRLREAALQDMRNGKGEELKGVLDSFVLQLYSKQFTPASTDKRELQEQSMSSTWGDRNIVHSIMEEFVAHLAMHWEAEAAKQRSFAARLGAVVAATEDFLLAWDSFSPGYAAMLAENSRANPWPLAAVAVVPVAVAASVLLPPYAHPENDWKEQTTFWVCSLEMGFWSFIVFPVFLGHTAGVVCNGNLYLRFTLWALACGAAAELATMAIAMAADVFPVPATHMVYAIVGGATLPSLWWCIPVEKRGSPQFKVQLFYSLVVLALVLALFGVCTVLLNAAISHVSSGWQMGFVAGYLAIKLVFEGCGLAVSRHLGADVMTNITFFATCCYQINLCVALSKASSWLIVAAQILVDVVENVYHLWCIRSPRNTAGHEQYIVASLVLREFVELMVPTQFLILHWLVRKVRPEYSVLVCNKNEEEVMFAERTFQVDILVEFIVSCLTYSLLVRRGHAPLTLLRALAASRLVLMVVIAASVLEFYWCMTHTHWGLDLSFRFVWLSEAEAEWRCGLTWHVPG